MLKFNADNKVGIQVIRDLKAEMFFKVRVVYCEWIETNVFEEVSSKTKNPHLAKARFIIQNYHCEDRETLKNAKVGDEFNFKVEKVQYTEVKKKFQLVKVFGRLVPPYSRHGFKDGQEIEVNFKGMKNEKPVFNFMESSDETKRLFVTLDREYRKESMEKLMSSEDYKVWKAKVHFIDDDFITVEIVGEKPIRDSHKPKMVTFPGCPVGEVVETKVFYSDRGRKNFLAPHKLFDQRLSFVINRNQPKEDQEKQEAVLQNARCNTKIKIQIMKIVKSKAKEDTKIAFVQILDPDEAKGAIA